MDHPTATTTCFAFVCNSNEKIIRRVRLFCQVFPFSKLDDQQILTRAIEVCEKEKIVIDQIKLEKIAKASQGDMRQALDKLQATFSVTETNNPAIKPSYEKFRVSFATKLCMKIELLFYYCSSIHFRALN